MRSILFGFLLFCLWATFARYYYVCKIKGHCGDQVEEVSSTRAKTLNLKLEDKIILKDYDQFAFEQNKIQPDLNADNNKFLDELAKYLKANPDQNLTLTGYYRESELGTRSGLHTNLGIPRALHIESLLEKRGIDGKRIDIKHEMAAGNDLTQPIQFDLSYAQADGRPDEYAKLQFTFRDMTYNFEFDSDSLKVNPGDPFDVYADSVKTYLTQNPELTMTIIGHTDNVDDHAYNDNLGMERANAAKRFFQSKGLPADKVKTESKGMRQPVVPNTTEANRFKNRRVNFKLD